MLKILTVCVVLSVFSNNCEGQVRDVLFLNHVDYIISVVQATISEVEERGWSNLKVPDTEQTINEVIFGRETLGNVEYTNGFLVSIQHVDIQQSTVQQVWNQRQPGLVDFQARVRLHNVAIGFDVSVNLNAEKYRYTGTYTHPMVNFEFSILKDLNQDTLAITVRGNTPTNQVTNPVRFLPNDEITDILNTLYNRSSTIPGIIAWGPEILTPILDDVVRNKIEFPTLCYNCRR